MKEDTPPASIRRAQTLLGLPDGDEQYVWVKVRRVGSRCWCNGHSPETWRAVNAYIAPFGPVRDHGDVLFKTNGVTLVLEHHETGPEVVVYLALCTSVITLAASVVNLITAIVKASSDETRESSMKITVTRPGRGKSKGRSNRTLNLETPLSKSAAAKLNRAVEEALGVNRRTRRK